MVNSGSVADRVLAYYSGAKTLSAGIVAGAERPGDAVVLEDAFGDMTAGIMQSMDIRISATLKADTTIVTGYVPESHGNDYTHSVVLHSSGAWTVPDGVTKIRRVLIGGGNGGSGGTSGTAGSKGSFTQYDPRDAWYTAGSSPGNGGDGGTKGQGGKIYSDEIAVVPGHQISYNCGTGGTGGGVGAAGGNGTDTTFGNASSATGNRSTYGFYDYYSGIAYGTDGIDGYDGGDGAKGVNTDTYPPPGGGNETNIYPYDGLPGGNAEDGTRGGAGGIRARHQDGYENQWNVGAACGGSGGGGAYGVAGGNGGNGTIIVGETSNGNTKLTVRGGGGGNGATPSAGSAGANYGCGGNGGHGGGGGGCSGGAFGAKDSNGAKVGVDQDAAGVGGNGSSGGAGAAGCVVVYY